VNYEGAMQASHSPSFSFFVAFPLPRKRGSQKSSARARALPRAASFYYRDTRSYITFTRVFVSVPCTCVCVRGATRCDRFEGGMVGYRSNKILRPSFISRYRFVFYLAPLRSPLRTRGYFTVLDIGLKRGRYLAREIWRCFPARGNFPSSASRSRSKFAQTDIRANADRAPAARRDDARGCKWRARFEGLI